MPYLGEHQQTPQAPPFNICHSLKKKKKIIAIAKNSSVPKLELWKIGFGMIITENESENLQDVELWLFLQEYH